MAANSGCGHCTMLIFSSVRLTRFLCDGEAQRKARLAKKGMITAAQYQQKIHTTAAQYQHKIHTTAAQYQHKIHTTAAQYQHKIHTTAASQSLDIVTCICRC